MHNLSGDHISLTTSVVRAVFQIVDFYSTPKGYKLDHPPIFRHTVLRLVTSSFTFSCEQQRQQGPPDM